MSKEQNTKRVVNLPSDYDCPWGLEIDSVVNMTTFKNGFI